MFSCLVLFVLYFGVAAAGYFILGDQAQQNIIDSLCETPYKVNPLKTKRL